MANYIRFVKTTGHSRQVPVPLSVKVSVDETLVLQSYMEKEMLKVNPELEEPIVSKALLTYEIKSIDNLKEIPMPN